jgi:hypothetical protein
MQLMVLIKRQMKKKKQVCKEKKELICKRITKIFVLGTDDEEKSDLRINQIEYTQLLKDLDFSHAKVVK